MIVDDAQQASARLAAAGVVAAVLVVVAGLVWTSLIWFGPAEQWLTPLVGLLGVDPADPAAVGVVAAGIYFLPRLLAGVVALALPLFGGRLLTVLGYGALIAFIASDRLGNSRILDAMPPAVESAYDWATLVMLAIVSGAVWLWFKWTERSMGELETRFVEEDLRDARRPS